MDLNILRTFCKVAELGSFTKAAAQLKQPKSRISRAIGRLENELKLQLIRRTTRQMTLTEAGKTLFQKSHHLLNSLQSELETLSSARCEISGPLKITAPEDFGQGVLSHLLPRFLEVHPEVQFELLFSNEYTDLVAQEIDLAFRIGALQDSSLIQRKLGNIRVILVATPDYLTRFGHPTAPQDLHKFSLLSFQHEHDALSLIAEEFPDIHLIPKIKSNHFSLLLQMTLQNQGIATLPDFFVYHALKSGQLERVLPNWATAPIDLHLLYPPTKQMPLKTRTFIDFIVEESKAYLGS